MKEIQAALRALPVEMQRAAEVASLRGGAKVISDKAKSNAPVSQDGPFPGLLRESIGFNVKKMRGEYSARIGPRTGFAKTIGTRTKGKNAGKPKLKIPNKYAHLVELGTSHSAANPFLRPAAISTQGEVVEGMANSYRKHLDRVAKRIAKQRKR